MKLKIDGKERDCKLVMSAYDRDLELRIEDWVICVIDPDTRKLHLCSDVDSDATGLKTTQIRNKVKLGETR